MATTFNEDVVINGTVNMAGATTVHHAAGSITNAAVAAAAGIDYDKLDHLDIVVCGFDLPIGGTPAAREEIVFVARSTAVIRSFHAALNVTGSGSDTTTFDLKINGTSCLSAAVAVTQAATDRANTAATVSTTAVAQGAFISMEIKTITAAAARGPVGIMAISYVSPT